MARRYCESVPPENFRRDASTRLPGLAPAASGAGFEYQSPFGSTLVLQRGLQLSSVAGLAPNTRRNGIRAEQGSNLLCAFLADV